jgi:NAD(P)-dependent dehydrogenase (short-subunit alcohol dehydrogenase family)
MQRLVIITGASRGIGAQIALDLNKRFGENTRYLLIARDQPKLEEVKAQMSKENSNLVHSSTKNKFVVLAMDFSSHFTTKEMFELIKSSLTNNGEQQLDKLDELYVFYNHGTLSLAPVEEIADQMDEQFRTNVTSVWILMAAIREMFPISMVPVQFHINISSLLATKLIESFSAYSASRFSR